MRSTWQVEGTQHSKRTVLVMMIHYLRSFDSCRGFAQLKLFCAVRSSAIIRFDFLMFHRVQGWIAIRRVDLSFSS